MTIDDKAMSKILNNMEALRLILKAIAALSRQPSMSPTARLTAITQITEGLQ